MVWNWILFLTIAVSGLQLYSGYITTTKKINRENSNKLTKHGKVVVWIMFLTAGINAIAQLGDSYNKAQEDERMLRNTDIPLSPFSLTTEIAIPYGKSSHSNLVDELMVIKDSIEKGYESYQRFEVYDVSRDINSTVISMIFYGHRGETILKEFYGVGRAPTISIYEGDTTGLKSEELVKTSTQLPMDRFAGSLAYDTVIRDVRVDFGSQSFVITTTIPDVRINYSTFGNKKRIVQSDLIDKYLYFDFFGSRLERDLRLKTVRLEVPENRTLYMRPVRTHLKLANGTPSDTPHYVHKLSKSELGYGDF